MFKVLKRHSQGERDSFRIPKSVQQSIPIKRIFRDGIMLVGGKYSKTWLFQDINYSAASHEDQLAMFLSFCSLLNSLSTDATTKITVNNRRVDMAEFEHNNLMHEAGDGLDDYREEYNRKLLDMLSASNNLVQDKYITVSVHKKSIEEARSFFGRVHTDLVTYLGRMSSKASELSTHDRLRTIHDFFHTGDESHFRFDFSETMRKGHDFKDYLCPDSMEFKPDHFVMGDKFGRVLFLKEYATFIKDSMIRELCDYSRDLMLSIDILPIPTDEAVKEVNKKIMAVEGDITRWQQRQNQQNNFTATIPYEMEQMRKEVKEYMDDITTRDQRMMFVVVSLVHVADTLEELDADTDTLLSIGRKNLCTFSILRHQQEDGLNTALPYGLRRIDALRTLTTESTAVLNPFSTQEIMQPRGICYGQNAISRNPIICDRASLLNGNGFVLGVSGAGKSMILKDEMGNIVLNSPNHLLIIDPEGEYDELVKSYGGSVVEIGLNSPARINAMAVSKGYGAGENPLVAKSEFMLSLCEQSMGAGQLGPQEKSIIDRCTSIVLKKYIRTWKGDPPTLVDFYKCLLEQPEPQAKDIALGMELFVTGTLNMFAEQTNVDMSNRITSFNLRGMGKRLKAPGTLIATDTMDNRVAANRLEGIRTHLYIDEIYLFFANEFSGNFLSETYKRIRKMNGEVTGATQNVEDCLRNPLARTMLANSEFLIILNQATTDRVELAKLLSMSDTQLSYITNAEAGRGLIRVGPALVPFINEVPRDTKIYRLMSTKPGESA